MSSNNYQTVNSQMPKEEKANPKIIKALVLLLLLYFVGRSIYSFIQAGGFEKLQELYDLSQGVGIRDRQELDETLLYLADYLGDKYSDTCLLVQDTTDSVRSTSVSGLFKCEKIGENGPNVSARLVGKVTSSNKGLTVDDNYLWAKYYYAAADYLGSIVKRHYPNSAILHATTDSESKYSSHLAEDTSFKDFIKNSQTKYWFAVYVSDEYNIDKNTLMKTSNQIEDLFKNYRIDYYEVDKNYLIDGELIDGYNDLTYEIMTINRENGKKEYR